MAPINPAIARDLGNGSHFCVICNIAVKTKTWTAHSTGRQHRDSIQRLKAKAGAQQKATPKRPVENGGGPVQSEPVAKKPREDFEASESSAVPWERERRAESKKTAAKPEKAVAEKVKGVPSDFFEVQIPQSSAAKAPANPQEMDEELARFDKEVEQIDLEQLKRMDEPEEIVEEMQHTLTQDIDEVVDSIEEWKRVNELEIKMDEMKQQCAAMQKPASEPMESDSDDDDDDLALNWRSTKI